MPTLKFDGQLEIDQLRGVIYFHDENGMTLLRICSLPVPIPEPGFNPDESTTMRPLLDVTHMHGASWRGSVRQRYSVAREERDSASLDLP